MKCSFQQGNDTLMILIGEEKTFPEIPCSILYVSGIDWNADLSPWKAKAIFKKSEDFEGKADTLISELISPPLITDPKWKHRIVAGYSLAGLFSLYACTKTDLFDGCVSCSGSLWYPGFVQYLKQHPLLVSVVYLSLGEKEKHSRNPVLSEIKSCTEEVMQIVKQNHTCLYEINPGGHFTDRDGRIHKGITWTYNNLPVRK